MATITNTGSGNWSSTTPDAPWSGGTLPGATDDVVIAAGTTVTLDASQTFGSSPASNGYALTINGKLDFGTVSTAAKVLTVNGGITVSATGELAGDANGFLNQILINNGTTSLNYYFYVADGGKLTLTDGGARTRRFTTLSSNASSGQANIVTTDDVSADWKAGDTVLVCRHTYNAASGTEKKIIQSISGTTITLTTNLAGTHNTPASVYLLSRGWMISPSNDSYRIRAVTFSNTVTKKIDCSDLWIRVVGDAGTGKDGIIIDNLNVGVFDNCVMEDAKNYLLQTTNNSYVTSNWLFYLSNGAKFFSSMTSNCSFNDCYYVENKCYWSGTVQYQHFNRCRFDSYNGNFLDNNAGQDFNDTIWKSVSTCYLVNASSVGIMGTNDTFESGINYAVVYTNSQFGRGTLINPTLTSGSINNLNATPGSFLRLQKYNGNANDNRWYDANNGIMTTCGAGLTDTLTRTAGEITLGVAPTAGSTMAANFEITKAMTASKRVTIVGYFRKNSSYGAATLPTVTLTSQDGAINTSATLTDVDDTWVAFTLDGTVGAANTYITFKMTAQSANASAKCYFADMNIIIGSTTGIAAAAKIGTIWKNGVPSLDEWLGGTVSQSYLATIWDALKTDHTVASSMGKTLTDAEIKADDSAVMGL